MVVRAVRKSSLFRVAVFSTHALILALSPFEALAQPVPASPEAQTPALATAPASSSDTIKQTEALLNRLEDQEATLLQGSKGESNAPSAGSEQLKRLQEEKRALELQQENLVSEVVRLKQRLKSAEQPAEALPGLDGERRAQELARELTREQTRARQLELEMDQMKQAASTAPPVKVDEKLQRELDAERLRNRNLEAEIDAVKQQIGPRVASQKEQEQLLQKIAAGDALARQLEKELEARKKVAADNNFLRAELEKLQRHSATLQGKSGEGERAAARIADLESTLKAAIKQREALESKLIETTEKNAADRAKLAEIFSTMKSDLEAARAETTKANEKIATLTGELTSKAKAEEILAERTIELERNRQELTTLQANVESGKKANEELTASLAESRVNVEAAQQEREKATAALSTERAEATKKLEEIEELKRQLAKSIDDARTFSAAAEAKAKEAAQIPDLQAQIVALNGEISKRDADIKRISGEKSEKEQFLVDLSRGQRECMKEKNELLMAREECRLLSKQGGGSATPRQPTAAGAEIAAQRDQIFHDAGGQAGRQANGGPANPSPRVEQSTDGVMYVEVTVDKAKVRTLPDVGRGAEVLSASKGMQLTVEKREGDWYSVITPTGERGWILDNLVKPAANANIPGLTRPRGLYGDGEAAAPRSPAKPPKRTGSAESDLEPFGDVSGDTPPKRDSVDRAFDRLKSSLGKP